VRAIDGVNPLSPDIAQVRSAGFTAVMITPGSGDVVCGQAAVAKLAGERDFLTVLDPYAALKAALGENPISVFAPVGKAPCNRMSTASLLDETQGRPPNTAPEKKPRQPEALNGKSSGRSSNVESRSRCIATGRTTSSPPYGSRKSTSCA
jgi:hypothetical protein